MNSDEDTHKVFLEAASRAQAPLAFWQLPETTLIGTVTMTSTLSGSARASVP
jgi:hypothetical protein